MPARPADKPGKSVDPLMASLGVELRRRRRSWPGAMSRALREYLAPWQARRRREPGLRSHPPPYWYILPKLLWSAYRKQGAAPAMRSRFLRDVLLGQYCLFLAVRIQDDFLDGQAKSPVLVFVAQRLLVECREAFARHFQSGSRFWGLYEECLTTTVQGIFTVERLQRQPALKPQALLKEYAHVAAIFTVGMGAVCVKTGRMRDLGRMTVCADGLASFGQILDDMEDIAEDFARGRYNYCSAVLIPRARGRRPRREDLLTSMGKQFLFTPAALIISRALRGEIESAVRAAGPLELPGLRSYLKLHESYADEVDRLFHAWRVRAVFPSTIR